MTPVLPRLAVTAALLTGFASAAASHAPVALAAADAGMIGSFRLPGDAEIITSEDHDKAFVVIDTWLRVGSSADFDGLPGVAEATMRAILTGGKKSLASTIADLRGEAIVDVGRDYSHLQVRVPTARFAAALNAVGEAFENQAWAETTPAVVTAPMLAALETTWQNPESAAVELFMQSVFGAADGHTVAGTPESLRRLSRKDLQAFFNRYYVPSRMKVVLVGDFDTGKSVGMVVNAYASVLKRASAITEPPSRGDSRPATPPWPHNRAMVVGGAKGPAMSNLREYAALALLTRVLAGAPFSRLDRALQEPKVASLSSARLGGPSNNIAMVVAVSADPAAAATVEKGLRDALADLRTNPVSLDEHSKAISAVATEAESYQRDIWARSVALGASATLAGDPYWARKYPEVVRQISRQDMLAAAQKYLTPDQIVVLVLKK